jgi:CRP/FNR family transcriptional regulator, nitrogen oxide reductase regulator
VEWKREGTTGQPTGLPHGETSGVRVLAPLGKRVALAQQSTLFTGIARVDCTQIVAAAQEKILSRRQPIFFVGDPIRQLWMLTSGCVKIMQVGPSGSEVILRVAGPGDVIGAFGSSPRDFHCSSAQAVHASRVLGWEASVFEALAERFPILRRNMMRVLGERLHDMDERFREISTEKVAARLSSQLGRLLIQVGRPVEGGIEICLSREELAQLTATTLFTVSRTLSLWEQQGIVKARREAVLICDTQALGKLSEGD